MSYIIKIRNFLIETIKLLIPLMSIILVYILNLTPLKFVINMFGISNSFTQAIAPTAEAGFLATIISLIVAFLLKSISLKNIFDIQLYDNYMEDKLIIPLAGRQSNLGNKKYKLYLKSKIKYSNIHIKKMAEYKDDLIIRVVLPTWSSYEIENIDDLGQDVIVEKSKNEFEVNVSKYIGKNQFKCTLTVKIEIVSNSFETRFDGQAIAGYYLIPKLKSSSIKDKIISFFYKVVQIILIFFKIDIKNVDKDISTS